MALKCSNTRMNPQRMRLLVREIVRERVLEAQQQRDQETVGRLEFLWEHLVRQSDPACSLAGEMRQTLLDQREADQSLVAALEGSGWTRLKQDLFADADQFDELRGKVLNIAKDPAMLPIHLLGATGQERAEECHTTLLCRLLDPSGAGAGPLGLELLRSFLRLVLLGSPMLSALAGRHARVRDQEWLNYLRLVLDVELGRRLQILDRRDEPRMGLVAGTYEGGEVVAYPWSGEDFTRESRRPPSARIASAIGSGGAPAAQQFHAASAEGRRLPPAACPEGRPPAWGWRLQLQAQGRRPHAAPHYLDMLSRGRRSPTCSHDAIWSGAAPNLSWPPIRRKSP